MRAYQINKPFFKQIEHFSVLTPEEVAEKSFILALIKCHHYWGDTGKYVQIIAIFLSEKVLTDFLTDLLIAVNVWV